MHGAVMLRDKVLIRILMSTSPRLWALIDEINLSTCARGHPQTAMVPHVCSDGSANEGNSYTNPPYLIRTLPDSVFLNAHFIPSYQQ